MNLSNEKKALVRSWALRALLEATPGKTASIHSDELAALCTIEDTGLLWAWSAYILVVDALGARLSKYKPVLSIDLIPSEQLDVQVPIVAQLQSQMSDEPPSIHIVDRDSSSLLQNFETYRVPLRERLPSVDARPDLFYFYECSRSEQAREFGWEYGRRISVEHFPEELPFGGLSAV